MKTTPSENGSTSPEQPWEQPAFISAESQVIRAALSAVQGFGRKIDLRFPFSEYGLGIDFSRDSYVIGHKENRDSVFLTLDQAAKALLTLTTDEIALLFEGISERQAYHIEQTAIRAIQAAAALSVGDDELQDTKERFRTLARDFSLHPNIGLDKMISRLRDVRESDVADVRTTFAPTNEE